MAICGELSPLGLWHTNDELKMSCSCKIVNKRLIHLHTLHYTMTENDNKTTQSKDQRQIREILSEFEKEMLRQKKLERRRFRR